MERSVLVPLVTSCRTLDIKWRLYASHTSSHFWKLSCPHTLQTQSFVRSVFIQPFRLKATTTAGIFASSGTTQTPLNTTNGLSFLPLARTTVNRAFPCPVERTGTDLVPILSTVVSPGMSIHRGVSSMFPMQERSYRFLGAKRRMFITNDTTLGTRSLGSLCAIVVLRRREKPWRWKNFSSQPLLATKSQLTCESSWISRAFSWIARLVTRRFWDVNVSIQTISLLSKSVPSSGFLPPPCNRFFLAEFVAIESLAFHHSLTRPSSTLNFLAAPLLLVLSALAITFCLKAMS